MRDKNVEYMMNDAATVIAFVQEGDLWSYSPGNEKVNQVFSFRKLKDGDFRDSRTQHDIKIVRVTDEGDIDFVLYGYMNRGSHEGYEGIAVYHYNRDKNVAEERAFIPVSESFEFLKKDLEKLSYVNEKNELFLILAKNLYRINIEENSSEILEKGIKNANFVSSDNNDHAAWLVSEGDEKGNIKEITAVDWVHATQGNASADIANTFLLLKLQFGDKSDIPEKYISAFCELTNTKRSYVNEWLPLVAAARLTKNKEEEKELLNQWINVVDFQ